MTKFADTQTIGEAKAYLHDRRFEGARCPCCDHMHRIYRRRVSRSQVRFMHDLATLSRQRTGIRLSFVDVREIAGAHMRGGDYAKLAYWGLVQRAPEDPGLWALTAKGWSFLQGRIRIPRYLWIEDGSVVREDSDTVDVHDANRATFVLSEVLA
jgi:hypothetical protein